MSLLLLMYCAGVMAQTADVSGKVIDEQGEPVIGASVVQKGTSMVLSPILMVILPLSLHKCYTCSLLCRL